MYVRIDGRDPNSHAHTVRIAVELNGIDETYMPNLNMYGFSGPLFSNKISTSNHPENTAFSSGGFRFVRRA